MKVAVLSGSWPPDRCGVGDYTGQLADALEASGADVLRTGRALGSVTGLPRTMAELRAFAPDIVHLQYPTTGFHRSLAPALTVAVRTDTVVTLHEFASFRFYRLPWFAPFAWRARALVFTSPVEQASFRRRMRHTGPADVLIPIGSNIPRAPEGERDPRLVCCFGLLMPDKGWEAFLTLAERFRRPRYLMIGAVPARPRRLCAGAAGAGRGCRGGVRDRARAGGGGGAATGRRVCLPGLSGRGFREARVAAGRAGQ